LLRLLDPHAPQLDAIVCDHIENGCSSERL
jgi:hypothetical protein